MSSEMPMCKITVLKRTIHPDLIAEYLDDSFEHPGLCDRFEEGQEFVIDPSIVPEEFCACCAWAWADIRKDILAVASGSDMVGMRQRGTVITGCRDWFRPVIFKVERRNDV
jgi:uncharacterized repeat protein (TIGR04076 family)